MSTNNIVLVGAGLAGFLLFKELAAKLANTGYNLIIIEPREFVVHLPSTIRMVVTPEGSYENKSIMDHPSNLSSDNVRFVYAEVTSINEGSNGGRVELNNGESVDYSILILATGSRWAGPVALGTTKNQILASVSSWRTKFADAQDIVFVGGGAIGLGEITLFYSRKMPGR
jgi:NADH dehydrogenase FAD-containing subunit